MEGKSVYRYVKALVRDRKKTNRWQEVDLSEVPVASLFNLYREVLLTVTHDTLPYQLTVDLKEVASQFNALTLSVTVSEWLEGLDGESLPTQAQTPFVSNQTAKYRDAFLAGYKAELVFSEGNPYTDVPDSEKDDILLSKDGVDYSDFYKNCLVTVNGMIHRTDYDAEGVYVKDGGTSFRVANENHLGIINFRSVGELEFITITSDMLYNPHRNGDFRDAVYIRLPKEIGNKMVMLVIGGYLHMVDSYYHCISESVIKIDTANLPLLPRFYESKKLIDLSDMQVHHDSNSTNPGHVALGDLFKNESIGAYLTLSQSFVVLVDTDNLYLEKHKLGYTHLPGRYYSHREPNWPARTELGRLPEYIAIPETNMWTIAMQDNFSTRYIFDTYDHENGHSVDPSRISADPVFYAQGHLLEIGTDKVVYKQMAA